jgi:hypothetical protein
VVFIFIFLGGFWCYLLTWFSSFFRKTSITVLSGMWSSSLPGHDSDHHLFFSSLELDSSNSPPCSSSCVRYPVGFVTSFPSLLSLPFSFISFNLLGRDEFNLFLAYYLPPHHWSHTAYPLAYFSEKALTVSERLWCFWWQTLSNYLRFSSQGPGWLA